MRGFDSLHPLQRLSHTTKSCARRTHLMRCQKFATVFSPNTNAFVFVLVPPGLITYWMFSRTCRPASGR